MSHRSDNCFGKGFNQHSIKEGLGGTLGNRSDYVKHYIKYKHKWRKDTNYLKNQNKMIYSLSKKSGSHRELKNIKKIKAKASNNHRYSISNSSTSESDSYSYLSSDGD